MASGDDPSRVEELKGHEGTLYQAIVSSTYTIKKHIDLKKVTPQLTDKKTISKSTRKLFKASEKADKNEWFIQALLQLDLNGYALFLSALEEVGDEDHCTILSVISTELKHVNLSRLIKESSDLKAVETIERIRDTYFHESIHQDLPEGSQSIKELPSSKVTSESALQSTAQSEPTPLQPTAQSEPTISQSMTIISKRSLYSKETHTFTKTASSMFNSSLHGVSVSVPEEAFPPNVSTFELSMTASLESPLPFDLQHYSPCSCVVSLTCQPPIEEFGDYVTVEVPHCVLNVSDCEDHLCVLSAPDAGREDVEFQEDPDIEVDFNDSRYVMFKTKHFSQWIVVVSKRKSKQKRYVFSTRRNTKKDVMRKASSFDTATSKKFYTKNKYYRSKSQPVPTSVYSAAVVEYCVAMHMLTPKIKAEDTLWTVIFIVTLCVPTALDEHCALQLGTCDVECLSPQCGTAPFVFTKPFIQFSPTSFDGNGWKATAFPDPPVITRTSVERLYKLPDEKRQAAISPNCQLYYVQRVADNPGELMAEITVEGADCCGETVVFTLVCPSLRPRLSAGEVAIPSIVELYSTDSPIRQALSGTTSPHSVPLSLDDRDTISLLAELSFHLHNWKDVAHILNIEQTDIDNLVVTYSQSIEYFEAAFQMLRKWVAQYSTEITMSSLLGALQSAGIAIIQESWRQKLHAPNSLLTEKLDHSLRTRLPRQIASQWKFVARFLGFKESEIDNIESDNSYGPDRVVFQSREMISLHMERFQSIILLKDAIHAVYKHSRYRYLADALWFVETPST